MSDQILKEAYDKIVSIEEEQSPEEEQINVLTLRMRRATEEDDEAAYVRAVTQLNALTDKMNAPQVDEDVDNVHDKAIDLIDDMLDALDQNDQYGEKGDIFRHVLTCLQDMH